MTDVFSKRLRSHVMRQVRSKNNLSTEIKLISFFRGSRIVGWRRNSQVFGKPDFIFPKKRIAVFVDGCFWHGHRCRNTKPKCNREYWAKKIKKNRIRDRAVTKLLLENGWKVLRFWECELEEHSVLGLKKLLR